ncbi:hypothetical protein GGF39_003939 [Coemansia sp. RSA 1721]|nr:hypothetical protein GGF39_003939 [Coemansia sp. RSA 1721]
MSVKRKYDIEQDCSSLPAQFEKTKLVNSGKEDDAVSRTQMLMLFGQRMLAAQTKTAKQTKGSVDPQKTVPCSHCAKQQSLSDIRSCIHCGKYQCSGCTQLCYCCGNQFCSNCSIYDYSEFETRSVCFDCSS